MCSGCEDESRAAAFCRTSTGSSALRIKVYAGTYLPAQYDDGADIAAGSERKK